MTPDSGPDEHAAPPMVEARDRLESESAQALEIDIWREASIERYDSGDEQYLATHPTREGFMEWLEAQCLAKRERLRIVVEQLLRAGWLDDASAFDVDGDELGSSGGASAPAAPAATPQAAAAVAVSVTEAVAVSAAAVPKLGTGRTSSGEGGGGGIDL